MTLKEIVTLVISSVVIVAGIVFAIKLGELYKNASETLEKTNEIVDTVHKRLPDIENVLNIVAKLPSVDPPSPKK